MKIDTRCPHCLRTYKLAQEHVGQAAKCKCGQHFVVTEIAHEEPAPVTAVVLIVPLSIQRNAEYLKSGETVPTSFASEEACMAVLQALQSSMPEVKSAYVPSGRTSTHSAAALWASSAVGAVLGALTGHAVVGAGLLLIYLVVIMAGVSGGMRCCWVCGLFLIGIGMALGQPMAIGGVTGWLVGAASKIGKNRSPGIACIFGAIAGAAALVLCYSTLNLWFDLFAGMDTRRLNLSEHKDGGIGRTIYIVAGGIIAPIASASIAWGMVVKAGQCHS